MVVARDDLVFGVLIKFVGVVYDEVTVWWLVADCGWDVVVDGVGWWRVVASFVLIVVVEILVIWVLLVVGVLVVCVGGGGILVVPDVDGVWCGVEVVIDKDFIVALLVVELGVDALLFLIDVVVV